MLFTTVVLMLLTLLPKMSTKSTVIVSWLCRKKMMYSRSGFAGDLRNNLENKSLVNFLDTLKRGQVGSKRKVQEASLHVTPISHLFMGDGVFLCF